jgi:hypothetical protein
MEERERKNRTPPKHAERRERERPHRPRKRGPVPAGFGGHSRLLLPGIAARVLAAGRVFVRQIA